MQSIELANTGKHTSRLGYGCSALMGSLSRSASLKLLEAAFEEGIRHFDVAPMYGQGEAEGCLGEFMSRHRGDVTVTTKFGLAPGRSRPWMKVIRRMAGPVLRRLPSIRQRFAPASDVLSGTGAKLCFDGASASLSLENSLRELRSGHVDLLLLHEAEASDLYDDTLLRFLEDAKASGKIGAFGVGSEASRVPRLLSERMAYCPVLQYEWSLFDAPVATSHRFRLHHRSMSTQFQALQRSIATDQEKRSGWSTKIGKDLLADGMLASLMLKASLELNPASIILFSSKSAANIRSNVRTCEDVSLGAPALRLRDLVRSSVGDST